MDRRRWDDWIALYAEDAIFWVPSWADEETLVEDPEVSLNLMYLVGRETIRDRIFRIRTTTRSPRCPWTGPLTWST